MKRAFMFAGLVLLSEAIRRTRAKLFGPAPRAWSDFASPELDE